MPKPTSGASTSADAPRARRQRAYAASRREDREPDAAFELDERQHHGEQRSEHEMAALAALEPAHPGKTRERDQRRDPEIRVAGERDMHVDQRQRAECVDRDHRAIARKSERAQLSVDAGKQRKPEHEPERADDAGVPVAPGRREPERETAECFRIAPGLRGAQRAARIGEPFVEADEAIEMAAEHPCLWLQQPRRPCVPRIHRAQQDLVRHQPRMRGEQREQDPEQRMQRGACRTRGAEMRERIATHTRDGHRDREQERRKRRNDPRDIDRARADSWRAP